MERWPADHLIENAMDCSCVHLWFTLIHHHPLPTILPMDHLSISFPCPAEDSCGSRASGSENRRRFKMKPAVFGPCAAVAWISSSSRVEPTKHGEMTPPKKKKTGCYTQSNYRETTRYSWHRCRVPDFWKHPFWGHIMLGVLTGAATISWNSIGGCPTIIPEPLF